MLLLTIILLFSTKKNVLCLTSKIVNVRNLAFEEAGTSKSQVKLVTLFMDEPLAPLFKAINQMKHKLETSFTISVRGLGPVNFTWNESDVVT